MHEETAVKPTMADAADHFSMRLAVDIGAEDISLSILKELYGSYITDLAEPNRVKRAIYQRIARPHLQMMLEQRPKDILYHKVNILTDNWQSIRYSDFAVNLKKHLDADHYSPYHTAEYRLRHKLVRENPDVYAPTAIIEAGFNVARLLSDLPDLATMTHELRDKGTYPAPVHTYLIDLFEVGYDLLKPGRTELPAKPSN